MRTSYLLVAALFILGAGACTESTHSVGMRVDGVLVDCTQRGDDVSRCSAVDNPCDSANVLWPPNHKMVKFTLGACAPAPGCGGGGDGGDGGGSGSGSGSGSDGDIIIERTLPSARAVAAAAAADPTASHITSITADEDVEVGKGGDGHTLSGDIAIVDAVSFDLRSERQGGGDGRVYRVNFVDAAGVTGSCEFHVPHDQGPTRGAADSGTIVTVTP